MLFLGLPNQCIINVSKDVRISLPKMSMINIQCSLLEQSNKSLKIKVFGILNYGVIEIKQNRRGTYIDTDNNTIQNLLFTYSDIKKDEMLLPEQYGIRSDIKSLYDELSSGLFQLNTQKIKFEQHFPCWDDSSCVEIRNIVPLSLNGKSDLQKATYIIRWINRYFIPGTMVEIPEDCSAIYYLKQPKSPMNCRTYSIVANDMLNSWGLRSRAIHCHPQNEYDIESHFVNEVYIKELHKWILLDAAFGCMICDDKMFLNVKEIRDRIIEKRPMYLYSSPHNKKENINKIYYWEMIIKDFYYFTFYTDYSIGYNCFHNNQVIVLPLKYQTQKYINKPITNNIDQFY